MDLKEVVLAVVGIVVGILMVTHVVVPAVDTFLERPGLGGFTRPGGLHPGAAAIGGHGNSGGSFVHNCQSVGPFRSRAVVERRALLWSKSHGTQEVGEAFVCALALERRSGTVQC